MPTMDRLTADIEKTTEKLEQLKRQKRDKEARDREKKRKEETRLKIIVGAVVLSYFPQLQQLQPQKNNAENDVEFSKLAAVCSALAADKEYLARLIAQAEKSPAQNMQGKIES